MTREWGDGGNKTRLHEVVESDMHSPLSAQFIDCRCGERVTAGNLLHVGNAWQAHTGRVVSIPRLEDRATDSEVEEFLKKVEDPTYESDMSGGAYVTKPYGDLEDAFYLLERLYERQALCTCVIPVEAHGWKKAVTKCPNFREGDL